MAEEAPPPTEAPSPPRAREFNVLGAVGFVLSFIGLSIAMICFPPIAILSIIGGVLSAIGLKQPPRGLAIAGVVMGIAGAIVGAIFLFLISQHGQPGELPAGEAP